MSKKNYIAYGSNLNKLEMQKRCPDAKAIGVSELLNYKLAFRGSEDNAYLTIEENSGSIVPVAIWEVSEEDEIKLDEYEDYPNLYFKEEIELPVYDIASGEEEMMTCFVYIMNKENGKGKPTQKYVDTCLQGYDDFDFDQGCLNEILKIK